MKLSEMIVRHRQNRGLSQRQFAELCGLSNGYISMLEAEANPKTGEPISPTLNQLRKLAKGMNTTAEDLISAADDLRDAQSDSDETGRDLQRRLRRAIGSKGFSYERLERLTGISKSSIQRYASGTTKEIPASKVKVLADALDVDLVWMMGQAEEIKKQEEPADVCTITKKPGRRANDCAVRLASDVYKEILLVSVETGRTDEEIVDILCRYALDRLRIEEPENG